MKRFVFFAALAAAFAGAMVGVASLAEKQNIWLAERREYMRQCVPNLPASRCSELFTAQRPFDEVTNRTQRANP